MKKSEMINKLQDMLINMGFKTEYECGCCHKEPTFEEAQTILNMLENEEMLPPHGSISRSYHPDYPLDVHTWDNEDE